MYVYINYFNVFSYLELKMYDVASIRVKRTDQQNMKFVTATIPTTTRRYKKYVYTYALASIHILKNILVFRIA